MRVAVIYESRTGTTRRAAEAIASAAEQMGNDVGVFQTAKINLEFLAAADVVFVGTWTDGIFIIGQRPGDARRLNQMPGIWGKPTAGFVTYAVNPGRTLRKLGDLLKLKGANFIGGEAFKRTIFDGDEPAGITEYVATVLASIVPAKA